MPHIIVLPIVLKVCVALLYMFRNCAANIVAEYFNFQIYLHLLLKLNALIQCLRCFQRRIFFMENACFLLNGTLFYK